MRAAVYHGRGDVRIKDVSDPRPRSGELLLRVDAAGICGTDAHEFATGPHLYAIGGAHPVSGHVGPLIPGHELAGTVVATGADVDDFAEGDLVVSGAGISCGTCHWCRRGRTNLCERYVTVGLQRDGGLAQYTVVPAGTVVDAGGYGLTADAAVLGQPMSIAVHAMRRGRLEPGDVAVVIGVGGIGAFLTYAVAELGAIPVVSDVDPERLAVAERLGARHVLDPAQDAPLGRVLRSQDLVPSVVYEVSGSAGGFDAAMSVAPRGCRVVAIGLQDGARVVDVCALTLAERELVGTNAHVVDADLPEALRLLGTRQEGWADVAPVALSLDHLVEQGLRPLAEHRSTRIKTLVDPWAGATRPTRM